MSATILQAPSDLPRFFQEHRSCATVVALVPDALDGAPALAAWARAEADAGRPVLLLGADGVRAEGLRRAARAAGLEPGAVASVREAALAVIAGAGPGFFRDARVLDANERDVLMEDMKVSGLKPGRLREMTKFFAKGIADGVSGDGDWLISAEEQRQFAILTENLDARRALLPEEVCAVALDALATPDGAAAARTLVGEDGALAAEGFHTLSATAQAFVEGLGAAHLVALGSDRYAVNSEEDYPNLAGCAALGARADAVAAVEPPAPAPADHRAAAHPAAEFDAVAALVAEAVAAGTAPGAVTVACPHPLWADAVARRLERAGIPARIDAGPAKAKGDPRAPERCGRLRTRALAKLVRDPDDFTAWRSWLGLGDWLLRSDAFLELMAWAREHGVTAAEAFRTLRATPDGERGCQLFAKFDETADALGRLLDALAGASGAGAVAALEEAGCIVDEPVRGALAARERFDGAAFAALVLDGDAPDAAAPADAVTVAPYRRAVGHHGDLTVVCGMVGGFLPALDATSDRETVEHRRRAYDRDRLLFEALKATAAQRVALTSFADDRIENADALGLDVARIYMEDGQRLAAVRPSPYLTDASPVPEAPTVTTRVGGLATL